MRSVIYLLGMIFLTMLSSHWELEETDKETMKLAAGLFWLLFAFDVGELIFCK